MLRSLNNQHFRVTPTVWKTLHTLEICKHRTRRSRKGGRCRRRLLAQSTLASESEHVRFALWNARSLTNKVNMLCDFVIGDSIDILAVTETWCSGDDRDDFTLAQLQSTLKNYAWYHNPRVGRAGGGVGVCVNKSFQVGTFESPEFSSFEHIKLLLTSRQQTPVHLVVIYRPQRTSTGEITDQLFLQEFSTF